MELVSGNTPIPATPGEGRPLASVLARHLIRAMQPGLAVLKAGRPKSGTDPAEPVAA